MPYITVKVDVDIDEFDDKDIIEEFKARKLSLTPEADEEPDWLAAAMYSLQRGAKQEGFIYLERAFPVLKGLLV